MKSRMKKGSILPITYVWHFILKGIVQTVNRLGQLTTSTKYTKGVQIHIH
jgi:hypothetical protein